MSVEASSRSSPVSEGKGAWRRPPVVCVIRRIYTHVDFDRRDSRVRQKMRAGQKEQATLLDKHPISFRDVDFGVDLVCSRNQIAGNKEIRILHANKNTK